MVMGRMIAAAMLLMYCVVVSGHYEGNPFVVRGRVYCDTCRARFETDATTDIPGAMVRIECKDREGQELKYSIEGVTNSNGTYNIMVIGDRGDDICDVVPVSSPQSDCAESDFRRNCARVILTNNNGVISTNRFANALGFLRNEPMPGCAKLLQKYKETDDDG